jgi:uncharacterized membrane protein
MSGAHLHLVLNHFPILGALFGGILLLIGMIKQNKTLEKAGLITFIVIALITIPAYLTGEAAEHATEHLVGSSHDMVHEHEELAEIGFIMMLGLGVLSLVSFFFITRNKYMKYTSLKIVVLVSAFFTFGMMVIIGEHGGEIRRPELRGEVAQSPENEKDKKQEDADMPSEN